MSFDKGKRGNELDEFEAHQFLEKCVGALTVHDMRSALKAIDIDFNRMMSLTEFLIFHYALQERDWVYLVNWAPGMSVAQRRLIEAAQAQIVLHSQAHETAQAQIVALQAQVHAGVLAHAALQARIDALELRGSDAPATTTATSPFASRTMRSALVLLTLLPLASCGTSVGHGYITTTNEATTASVARQTSRMRSRGRSLTRRQ